MGAALCASFINSSMNVDQLVTQLRAAYGDTLQSVILYGSAVAGEHIKKKSDYNVLVVLDTVPLDRLAAVGAVLRAWGSRQSCAYDIHCV